MPWSEAAQKPDDDTVKRTHDDREPADNHVNVHALLDNRLINNSRNFYIPVRLSCGVTAMCRPCVLVHCPLVLLDLNSDMYVQARSKRQE
jgi:hypothetical protein